MDKLTKFSFDCTFKLYDLSSKKVEDFEITSFTTDTIGNIPVKGDYLQFRDGENNGGLYKVRDRLFKYLIENQVEGDPTLVEVKVILENVSTEFLNQLESDI